MRRLVTLGMPCAAIVAMSAVTGSAQRQGPQAASASQASSAVIVVFQDQVDFSASTGNYQPDERAAADPPGWGYLDRGVAGFVQELEFRHAFRANEVYSHSIRGFAAMLTRVQVAALRNDPNVRYVEPDGVAYATAQTLPWGIDKIDADLSSTLAGNGSGAITNIDVYIIDTGVDAAHTDLNVVNHINFAGGPNTDCHGHGTHVAGTVAAKDDGQDVVGVAPGAPITGVKVLSCSGAGSWSRVIKGIDWVTAHAAKPAVANMSLAGEAIQAVDDAVTRSADSGVFYAVAAGNSGDDACKYSPARAGTHDGVLTVAATDSGDEEASWSNYGNCVDIWGPGASILSTKKGGGTTPMSGTSMASPHGAGSAALYLSGQNEPPNFVEAVLKGAAVTTSNKSKNGRTIIRLYVGGF